MRRPLGTVKDHEELYNKTNKQFKVKARKECLWERFANSCKWSVKVCKTWFESQRTHFGKLTQSGQAPKEMTERQNWIQDKFNFLKTHIRCKGLKSTGFKTLARGASASTASAHDISRGSADNIVWRSACNQTPQYSFHCKPKQFFSIQQSTSKSWTSLHTCCHLFFVPRQETTTTAFCNYLASEVEVLEDICFQTFRNEAAKRLRVILSRAEEGTNQLQQPQQPVRSRSPSVTSIYMPQTF